MVVVVGAGVAGLAASLALARDGIEVTLIDRDGFPEAGERLADSVRARPGCPQLNQGHSFLARAYTILEREAPEVLNALVAAGGNVTDANIVLPPEHHDDGLRALAIRRALVDEVLLSFVRADARITTVPATVASLEGSRGSITGVRTTDGATFTADLVVDASGRRSAFPSLTPTLGAPPPAERSSPCGLVYYGRFLTINDGVDVPPMFAPIAVRGSLGYAGFALFWQDGRTYILGMYSETGDRELRALRGNDALVAACRAIKPMAYFADPAFGTPVSDTVSMGGLHNTRRSYVSGDEPLVDGLVVIGDGLCHTDPTPAYGMSMALDEAFRLPALARSEGRRAQVALEAAIGPELDERYEQVARANRERREMAAGRPLDLESDVEFVTETGAVALGRTDPAIMRRYFRRTLAVDLPGALSTDLGFLEDARVALRDAGAVIGARRPTRDQLLQILADAEPSFA